MDLQLYIRVLWRFRAIVAIGVLIAIALAVLSMVRVSTKGLTYRDNELWSSTTRLGVTQSGFPWGRLLAEDPTSAGEKAATSGLPAANPDRLNALAVLYAELATSDQVRRLTRRSGPVRGKVTATPLRDASSGTMLPLIDLTATSTSPRAATRLAQRSATALESFLRDRQRANDVPAADRVIVDVVVKPKKPELYQPRSKTMPVVVFLVVMFGTVALAFLLENLRPRVRTQQEPATAGFPDRERLTA